MVDCSICGREVWGNVRSDRIITCGRCVQILLIAKPEEKIAYRDKLISKGRTEGARSVESFILEEVKGEIATFKRTLVLRSKLRPSTPRGPQTPRRLRPITKTKEKIENGREKAA